jgi:hypothetical protein
MAADDRKAYQRLGYFIGIESLLLSVPLVGTALPGVSNFQPLLSENHRLLDLETLVRGIAPFLRATWPAPSMLPQRRPAPATVQAFETW